jgi:hypothetical protein
MIAQERFVQALAAAQPAQALRSLVEQLSQEGKSKQDIYDALARQLLLVRASAGDQGAEEEMLLEVMDALSGWCNPSAQLLPGEEPAR